MEPYEESIDNLIAVAKILGRLSVEGHITPDELAVMQAELMKPEPQPIPAFISSPYYTPPNPVINPWGSSIGIGTTSGDSGKIYVDASNPFSGIGVLNSDNSNSNYLVLK